MIPKSPSLYKFRFNPGPWRRPYADVSQHLHVGGGGPAPGQRCSAQNWGGWRLRISEWASREKCTCLLKALLRRLLRTMCCANVCMESRDNHLRVCDYVWNKSDYKILFNVNNHCGCDKNDFLCVITISDARRFFFVRWRFGGVKIYVKMFESSGPMINVVFMAYFYYLTNMKML